MSLNRRNLITRTPINIITTNMSINTILRRIRNIIRIHTNINMLTIINIRTTIRLIRFSNSTILFPFRSNRQSHINMINLRRPILLILRTITIHNRLNRFINFNKRRPIRLIIRRPNRDFTSNKNRLRTLMMILSRILSILSRSNLPHTINPLKIPP